MLSLEFWEFLSYVVTVIGLPGAIAVFLWEKKRERENDEEEIYQKLSDEYADFLTLSLKNADLRLRSAEATTLTPEQRERKLIMFDILISLFERAYILVYEENMNKQRRRRWQSWEDYMLEWVVREDFHQALPLLLQGEDEEFVDYITRLAAAKKQIV